MASHTHTHVCTHIVSDSVILYQSRGTGDPKYLGKAGEHFRVGCGYRKATEAARALDVVPKEGPTEGCIRSLHPHPRLTCPSPLRLGLSPLKAERKRP